MIEYNVLIHIFLPLFFVENKGGSKMTDEKIIEYVMDSPENTNPSVLDSMLKSNKVQPDWEQNDETAPDYIKNRPFYINTQAYKIEWDGNTAGKTAVGGMYYKVSNITPDALTLKNIKIVMSNDTQWSREDVVGSTDEYWQVGEYSVICITVENTSIVSLGLTFEETGLYFMKNNGIYVSNLEYMFVGYVAIDEKYLPARTEIIMKSSTVGSIKKFKITVDDSGTLTTTAVTG